jgi:F-box and leucine-rich repeat protein 2/20
LSTVKETLTVLRLDGLEVFSSTLQAIGGSCKNLVEIGLSKCDSITDAGIASLATHCKLLSNIDLTCCHLVTDDALVTIAENCRGLECIRLESCHLISEKGLERIGTCCSQLKEIDLTDCHINDAVYWDISVSTRVFSFAALVKVLGTANVEAWPLLKYYRQRPRIY